MITNTVAVSADDVKRIQDHANEVAQSRVGELVLCDILDQVQSEFREIDPGKDSQAEGCSPDQCNTCSTSSDCTTSLLSKVSQEEMDAVPKPSFSVNAPSADTETEQAKKPTESQQQKIKDGFNPDAGLYIFFLLLFIRLTS